MGDMATTMEPPPKNPPGATTDPHGDGGRHSARRAIAGGAGIMMAAILGSRLLGLIRERVIAHQFGQGFNTDVYNGAFTIPDLLFFLIAGGALSGAFLPVFTDYISTMREKEAWRIFSVVASVMTIVVTCFIILGEIFTPQLVRITNPGFSDIPGKVEATVALTRILLPAQLCFFLGGLMMGTQTARNFFWGQALGPMIYNLGIILGGIFLARTYGVAGLCYGAVSGAVIGNLLLQWLLVRRMGGRFVFASLRENFRHPGVMKVWGLMLPVILGLALPQVSTIIGKAFASVLGNGPQSALMNANKLMQVPLGVFAQAIAIASLPTMSAQAARREFSALRHTVSFSLRSILFLTIPSSMVMFVLALPIVQLLLQSGKFSSADAAMAAAALRYFAIGIFAWSAHSILTRGFYALQESRTPIIVGTIVTFIFIPLNLVALRMTGKSDPSAAIAGLACVTSIAATIHMLSMLILLRLRLRGLDGGRLLISVSRITLASLITAFICRIVRDRLVAHFVARYGALAAKHVIRESAFVLLGCLAVSTVVYTGLALLLHMEEVNVVRRLARRFVPSAS